MKKLLALLTLCSMPVCDANGDEFYPFDDVTVDTELTDLYPIVNLIQGPGVGIAVDEPHDKILGGAEGNWVTAADAGFPADYIEEVGQPVIQFDLGSDRTLNEISVWGYASTNANGTSQFSLRFATSAEGPAGILGTVDYGQSLTYNPTFNISNVDSNFQQIRLFDETVTARYVEFSNVDNFFVAPGDGSPPTEEPDPRLLPITPGGDRVGLGEVAFMDLPDDFQPGDKIPRQIDGTAFGSIEVPSVVSNVMFGPEELGMGLAQEWYAVGNPGTKDAIDQVFVDNDPVVPAFRSASGSSWWTGNSTALAGVPNYPAEVQPQLTDNYTVRSTGEILIEQSGPFTFTDGIDDFTYLAIDTDRSGVAGDSEEEVLINDNTWTTVLRDGNGGGEGYAEISIDGITDGGEWLAIEFNMGEGGGGDSGVIYWDYDTTAPFDQRNGGLLLPFVDQAFFSVEEAEAALIPDDYLRSTTAPIVAADASGSFAESLLGNAPAVEFQVQIGTLGNDQIALEDNSIGDGVTQLDVSGTNVRIQVEDELTDGMEFQIFGADQVIGLDTLSLSFDNASQWDLSSLGEGVIRFGAMQQVCGDFDMDGDVDSADRTIQTTNWTGALPPGDPNATKTFAQGDCDGDGDVDTADQNGTITNWTGAMNPAGNLEDGDNADLIYDPATGNVKLDAGDTGSKQFISFVLGTGENNMRPENLTKSADGSAGPFFDVGTNTDATTFQIGQTDPLNQGAGPMIDLGDVFPTGITTKEALAEYLTLAEYASELGSGGTFDLALVPEPSGFALALLGLLGLRSRRRRR